ncbi:vanadium-dependent haloperoxidase [Flavisolibacter nicotianae]|uniref:vanadium-dependent haloperoxidase n=1 Tax=Flavisolibacter nicotianae TaxID=2364882 RepID=UPI000EAF4423|nr:vanadium-dependent haloperoxidase [Flavisolibacter nicotianae]
MKKLLLMLPLAAGLFSCKQKDFAKYTNNPLLFSKTVKRLNDVVLYNNFSPVVASRNYAYANIAAYECIAAGDSSYQSLSGQIKHLPQMPRPEAGKKIDYHLAALLSFVKVGNAVTFPEGVLMDYYNQLKEGADSAGMPGEMLKNTVAFSDTIAAAILKWSKGDNYAQTRSAEKFTVKQEDGRWIPTPPMYAQGMEPHWCDIRPLLMDSSSQFLPPLPPKYNMKDSTSQFCKEVMEVKRTGETLTAEQKQIADFFDDNPFNLHVTGHVMYATKKFSPPGHWMNIVGIAAQKSGADFNKTVAAYTETAIALFDGFIACWKAKYQHNTVRPETVINKLLDPSWQPYIQTPPFPSYVSGHSVISAASAEVMTHHFGDNFAYTDSSEREFGIPDRSFKSFRDAAQEASWSRLYGGIHYRSDLEQGNIVGKTLGEYVVQKLHFKKNENQLTYTR